MVLVVCAGTDTDSSGYNAQHNHWLDCLQCEEEMKIEIEMYKENEDGSADFHVNLDDEAKEFLIRYAIVACIKEGIESGKLLTPTEETE